MVGGRLDELVSDAIGAGGRGHLLTSYEGDEIEEGAAFLYRIG